MLRSSLTYTLLAALLGMAQAGEPVSVFPDKLADWKQAGPGKFVVKDGVATADGGMGLWWYSGQKLKNATIHLQFALSDTNWNSGVFVRFPDPGNDPWVAVRKGYEVQVSGDKAGKLATGAIYDLQGGSHIPLKRPGEWNDYKITMFGRYIAVMLNGELINVYTTQHGRGDIEGYFGLQNHDPKSAAKYKDIKIQEWTEEKSLGEVLGKLGVDRANWARYAAHRGGEKWYQKMDVGTAWSGTFADFYQGAPRTAALKGLMLELNKYAGVKGIFDTETLRFSSAAKAGYHWAGTPWTGSHGELVRLANFKSGIFHTALKPGWSIDGTFDDPRKIKGYGNLPAGQARWNGHYRHGEKVVLDYSVGGARVLELPSAKMVGNAPAVYRQFDIAASETDRWMAVADEQGASIRILDGGKTAFITPSAEQVSPPKPKLDEKKLNVVMDRTLGEWKALSMGAPSGKDFVDRNQGSKAYFRVLEDFVKTHGHGGDEEGVAVRLNDGLAAVNQDDVPHSFFFSDVRKPGRLELNLSRAESIERIHTYSWHKSNRAPQNYVVYGATKDTADPTAEDPTKAGWESLAAVNTSKLGDGGKHGVAITGPAGKPIGSYVKLLFVARPGPKSGVNHTFFSEIDVYTKGAPELQARAVDHRKALPVVAHLAGSTQAVFKDLGNGGLGLFVPMGSDEDFTLGIVSGDKTRLDEAANMLKKQSPESQSIEELLKGGAAVYPQSVKAEAKMGKEEGAWTTDFIGLPKKNPWFANIRFGDFDFFSDGDSAAACTWNGDVWIVSGLKGDWENVKWRRYATGLFESLGLKIVDDVVYVNGRDQITRLRDLNNDGEADWYENFNNDVLITENFHEFTFSLVTDKEGNFYICKGAPVLAGGRGFDRILPHHGIVAKIPKDGKGFEVLATGLRAPGGMGVGPNGEITTGENDGTWMPCCKLNYFTGKDKFLGVEDTALQLKGQKMHPPLCYLPMKVDNSGGGQVWVPQGVNWGVKEGELIHLSYGKSSLFRVLKEEVNGVMQGGVVKIPVKLKSSAQRARFHKDGSLYVIGFRGWQTNAATRSAFHRVRYRGEAVPLPDQLKVTDKGVYIRFEKELNPEQVKDVHSFALERWKYVRSSMYGSGEFSIDNPDKDAEEKATKQEMKNYRKHDQVRVAYSTLLDDKKTVFLHIPDMKVAEQMTIAYKLKFADGSPAESTITHTVHNMPPHKDLSLLRGKVEDESAKNAKLVAGLSQQLTVGGKTDRRISEVPALYVGADDQVSDMLGKGQFTSNWKGFLVLKKRKTPVFSFEGNGEAELIIDGKSVLVEAGKFGVKKSVSIKLDPGAHKFELRYKGAEDGTGKIRLFWEGSDFPRQTIRLTFFKHEHTAALVSALSVRHGRDLMLSQNCAQCHQDDKLSKESKLADLGTSGPSLAGVGSRLSEDWMKKWVADPHKMNPKTTMPALVDSSTAEGKQQAADIAAYLTTLKEKSPLKGLATNDADVTAGGAKFHQLGCAACHTQPNQSYDSKTNRIPLNNVSDKFSNESLAAFLKKPDKHHKWSKMPDFNLADKEAKQLAVFLRNQSKGKGTALKGLTAKGNVAKGKELVQALNCAACHDGIPTAQAKLPSLSDVMKSDWTKHGCVTEAKEKKTPQLNLRKEERDALAAFQKQYAKEHMVALTGSSSSDFAMRQYQQLNCKACHDKGDEKSLLTSYHTETAGLAKAHAAAGGHGKVDQSRPHMTYIGEMLHTDYMKRVLDGSVDKKARPWLDMRMPAFHARADLMAKGLSSQFGLASSSADIKGLDVKKSEVGGKLIGANGGFACTICHANSDKKAVAAFEVEGVNFDQMHKRLRGGYFHKWMENPLSITPDTKMPRYTVGNKSPLPDYGGDAQKQFEAILEYCKSLNKKKPQGDKVTK